MTGEARLLVRASVLGLLLAGVSTAALAAPDPREARIEQLEAQVRQLMADRARIEAQDEQLLVQTRDLAAQVEELRHGQAAQAQALQSQDQTIEKVAAQKPAPAAVVTTLANGRPGFTSADGRFTTTVHAVVQFDAGAYDQAAPGPIATDLRRAGRRSAIRLPTSISPTPAT